MTMEGIENGIRKLSESWDVNLATTVLEALRSIDLDVLRHSGLKDVTVRSESSLQYILLCYVLLVVSPDDIAIETSETLEASCRDANDSPETRIDNDVGIFEVLLIHRSSKTTNFQDFHYPIRELLSLISSKDYNCNTGNLATDLLICRSMHNGDTNDLLDSIDKYQQYSVMSRVLQFPKIISDAVYQRCYKELIVENSVCEMTQPLPNVRLSLMTLMEIIDQPDINLLQFPRLVTLLGSSFVFLSESHTDISELHYELDELGTTQTLLALLSYVQYCLSKFLLGFINGCKVLQKTSESYDISTGAAVKEAFKNITSFEFQLPPWFDKTMIFPLPPIFKSLFIYGKDDSLIKASYSDMIVTILDSLMLCIEISSKILNQYRSASINPFEIEGKEEINLKHSKFQLIKNVHLLTYIPIFSSMLLAEQMQSLSEAMVISNETWNMYAEILTNNIKEQVTNILLVNESVALYHLLKIVSRVSIDDTGFQRISIKLLNYLFFQSKHTKFKIWCKQNELCRSTIKTYVHLWNDGSSDYSLIYTKIINTKQPDVDHKKTILAEYLDLLPEDMKFGFSREEENKTIMPAKFNAYAAPTFMPAESAVKANSQMNPFLPIDQNKVQESVQMNKLTPIMESSVNWTNAPTTGQK